ncbi:LapD/MoxY N-terminal periplasmic domain-containing protein, partial [Aliarcobacter butzleri]
VTFDKNIINFSNQNNTIVPKWFKDLIPIYIEEQSNNISNGFTSNATIYMNTNVEKVYIELYEKAKKEFFSNLLWFCV